MERRAVLRGIGALAGASAVGWAIDRAIPSAHAPKHLAARKPPPSVQEIDGLPVAQWVVEENERPGSLDWVIHPAPMIGTLPGEPAPIEGYLDKVSYLPGETARLFVSTSYAHFHAQVFRIGYYQGLGGRLVYTTGLNKGGLQPIPSPTPGLNMIECNWHQSAEIPIGADWPSGAYVLKLIAEHAAHYVPFTIRDDKSHAAIAVQSSVTTWQAYNLYGGWSLYGGGSSGALADRSRVVSFDRPYRNPDENGSGDFLGNEFPFIFLAERHGLDVTYWTDVDLHARPQLLANHKVLVSLGHDEYWSWQMRFDGVSQHLQRGLNVAFLGANACYRQIRLEDSPLGVNRRVVCYKDAQADPIIHTDPRLATGSTWATDPPGYEYPESELIGSMYQSYGADAPLIIEEPGHFVFAGTGVRAGEAIRGPGKGQEVVGSEFDGFEPALPGPRNVTILAHSPVESVSGALNSDMTYYTVPGGGGVFATGTARFVSQLWDGDQRIQNELSFGVSPAREVLGRITLNVLGAFATGPASKRHPSVVNWTRFYAANTAPVASKDVP